MKSNNSVVSNVAVYGLYESMIASGYPMQTETSFPEEHGSKDCARALRLAHTKIGEGHDNFLNGIIVQFDLTLTVHAWKEAERYHFLDFVSSNGRA